VNDKLYIHEYIDIIGQNRAKYMHHMTANWSPIGQEERAQLCYGVWGVVGSTGRWPETVNMWEHDGWAGMAESFGFETGPKTMQDEKLAKWWAAAAGLRRGGVDRLLVPKPWTRTIEELCADGVRGEVYAHEEVQVPPGQAGDWLERVRADAAPLFERFGWELVGAWETAMTNDSECFLLWAIPTWAQWGEAEDALWKDAALQAWRTRVQQETTGYHRYCLVDSPLSPLKIGRQPTRDDRTDDWED
jgi:hypothetical protein